MHIKKGEELLEVTAKRRLKDSTKIYLNALNDEISILKLESAKFTDKKTTIT